SGRPQWHRHARAPLVKKILTKPVRRDGCRSARPEQEAELLTVPLGSSWGAPGAASGAGRERADLDPTLRATAVGTLRPAEKRTFEGVRALDTARRTPRGPVRACIQSFGVALRTTSAAPFIHSTGERWFLQRGEAGVASP